MDKKELVVLQISPGDLLNAVPVISKLNIIKNGTDIQLKTEVLNWSLLRTLLRDAPKPFRDILMNCCEEAVAEQKQHIKQRYSIQRAGISRDAFLSKKCDCVLA